MKPFTLAQAVKESKKAKTTLIDAIKSGRLSAKKDENGRYQIDPSELFRVYQPTDDRPNEKTESVQNFLEQKIMSSERELVQQKDFNEQQKDLNKELFVLLEKATKTANQLTLLLTRQKEEPKKENALWRKLFGKNKK